MSNYLRFDEIPRPSQKTKIIEVINLKAQILGVIRWWGAWRKYVFQANDNNPVFDKDCMLEITAEIDRLMEERKNARHGQNDEGV